MTHAQNMAQRLPSLYREGELLNSLLAIPALQIEILDEYALEVQRAHFFDATFDLTEAARVAALLDIAPESWQRLQTFRAWVHALRTAVLERGAVTRAAIAGFVAEYAQRYQQATNVTLPFGEFREPVTQQTAALVENPQRRRYDHPSAMTGIEPLTQFTVTVDGLDEATAAFLLVGLPSAPESVPVIANLTSKEALVFLGQIPPGARLWIRDTGEGQAQAQLEGTDVSDRLRFISTLTPGTPWSAAQVETPARMLSLRRGQNDLWFLPVAHFDVLGLDRFLLALADLALQQGRYDQTQFDHALFHQQPAALLWMAWVETQAATFTVRFPMSAVLRHRNAPVSVDDALQQLDSALNLGVQKLKAAGVKGTVTLQPFTETQRQQDLLTMVLPLRHRDSGVTGADQLPDAGGVFEVTNFEDSTFR
ncbi:MAG: hypothetical protein AB7P18_22140 [Candidatus Binatia bacterium]